MFFTSFSPGASPATPTAGVASASGVGLSTGLTAEELRDVEVHEVGVVEDDRLDGSLDLVAFVAVSGHDVHDLRWNPVLVAQRDTGERVTQHLAEAAFDHAALGVLVEFERFADVG